MTLARANPPTANFESIVPAQLQQYDWISQINKELLENANASQAAASMCVPRLAEAPKLPRTVLIPEVFRRYMTFTPIVADMIRAKESWNS